VYSLDRRKRVNKCKWWVIEGGEEYDANTGARSIDHKSIDQREREREREREGEKKKRFFYIVIGWERQMSIGFLTNVDLNHRYRSRFSLFLRFWLTTRREFFVLLMIDLIVWLYQWNSIDNFLFCVIVTQFLFLFVLPVVIEVWSIESMWAVSSVF